jgi:cell wall-associated NlpC family hydrolase
VRHTVPDLTPRLGDFACVPISGAAGRLVALGEKLDDGGFTQYQHAEIYITHEIAEAAGALASLTSVAYRRSAERFGWTFAAYPGGARLVPLLCPAAEVHGSLWSTGVIRLTQHHRDSIAQNALVLQGTPYSALDYFALAAHRLHLPIPGLRELIGDTGHLICSQLVDEVYRRAGIHLFNNGRWPGYVTPADLAAVIHAAQ